MTKQKNKTLLYTLIISFVVIWLSVEGWSFYRFLTSNISSVKTEQIIYIPKGSSSQKVIDLLVEKRLIREPLWFKLLLKYEGKSNKIKAGEITIDPTWTAFQLIDELVAGKTVSYPITFIAGETFKQSFQKITALTNIKQDLSSIEAAQKALNIKTHTEGMLLAETYFYSKGESAKSILMRSHHDLINLLEREWKARAKNLPLKSSYEALILASIVEKETGIASERAKIAGVFINRLNIGMRLQTDPTVIYGMGDKYDGNIRKRDLLAYTPYNTYKINGLPPTPISLASAESIKAVMHPEKTKAFYFVASGTGGHTFSNTLRQHNKAVRDYLRR